MAKNKGKAGSKKKGSVKKSTPALSHDLQQLFNQAVALHRGGNAAQAEQVYRHILQVQPRHADSLHLLGLVMQQRGQLADAAALVRRAIDVNGTAAAFHFNLGVILQADLHLADAVDAYRRAIRLNPDYLEAYENLSVTLQDAGEYSAAQTVCESALGLNRKSLLTLRNLATLYFRDGRTEDALRLLYEALAISPADLELHEKLCGAQMRAGQFDLAWENGEWRFLKCDSWLKAGNRRSTGLRHATANDIGHRRILVSIEQGVGDQVMFASCYPDLIAAAGATLAVENDARLLPLLTRSFPGLDVRTPADYDPREFDCQLRAGSLLRHFRGSAEAFSGTAYLVADADRVRHWKARLAALPGRKIGFGWRGGKEARATEARSIPLTQWQTLFDASGASNGACTFIALQYDLSDEEKTAIDALDGVVFFPELDLLRELDDLAALICALDMLISVDNSTVHMAGALGQTVWLLLPRGPDGRWQDARDDSLWYPGLRFWRNPQIARAGWSPLFRDIAAALLSHTHGPAFAALPGGMGAAAPVGGSQFDESRNRSGGGLTGTAALLLNDTADWYHWGCSGTSLTLHRQLRTRFADVASLPIAQMNILEGLPERDDQFDSDAHFQHFCARNKPLIALLENAGHVVVNGEGTLHGFSAGSAGLLYLIWIAATRFGKPVQIINHSCYPADSDLSGEGEIFDFYRRVYGAVEGIAIREPVSYRMMKEMGLSVRESFDCLPLFIEACRDEGSLDAADFSLHPSGPVVLAGCVSWLGRSGRNGVSQMASLIRRLGESGRRVEVLIGASACMAIDDVDFVQQLTRATGGAGFDVRCVHTEVDWLKAIAGAAALVSGRFHHSIAAAFLGTPLLVGSSNTPKIVGLLEALAMPDAFIELGADVDDLWPQLERRLAQGGDYLLAADRRQHLLELGRQNFAF